MHDACNALDPDGSTNTHTVGSWESAVHILAEEGKKKKERERREERGERTEREKCSSFDWWLQLGTPTNDADLPPGRSTVNCAVHPLTGWVSCLIVCWEKNDKSEKLGTGKIEPRKKIDSWGFLTESLVGVCCFR